ncbi:hypothetical protein AB1Y20_014724 [Prymnesium parvum]|uniref:IMP-specific 5'-nucleotidase 1 n=1 Tax=Prymnesium parvum TaxID=97485 RepID=A0AB34IEW1_PRYPA
MDHRSDALIAFIAELLGHSFVLDAMQTTAADTWAHVEELIEEHRQREGATHAADRPLLSRLSQAVPSVSSFLTPLPLRAAWMAYDAKYRVSRRRFVPPGFDDIRHVLNLAQVMALQQTDLRLVTFDGDCTLYKDGRDFSDEKLARYISLLLQRGVAVALVTAAVYQYDAVRYMGRLCGLLSYFQQCDLPADAAARFWVLGGESNYLLSCEAAQDEKGEAVYVLRPRPELWEPLWSPDEAAVRTLLDTAHQVIEAAATELQLRCRIIRKPRSVGLVVGGKEGKARCPQGSGSSTLRAELLDEVVLRLQAELRELSYRSPVRLPPYCAFNGGNDCWVDIGSKREGVAGLCQLLHLPAQSVLHVGDQFLGTGNDYAARDVCPCVWIIDPTETRQVLKHVLKEALGMDRAALKDPRKSHSNSGGDVAINDLAY